MSIKKIVSKKHSLFYIMFAAILVINIIDLVNYNFEVPTLIINPVNILLSGIIALLFYRNRISFETAFSTLIYCAQANLVISFWIGAPLAENYSAGFLRASLFFIMLVSALVIVNSKKHIITSGIVYTIFLSVSLIIREDVYLISNTVMFYFIILLYFTIVYYNVSKWEQQIKIQNQLNDKILVSNENLRAKNENLEEVNNILDKQTQKIEKQTEELKNLINTRDSFYSIISHDLKNPVGAMMGMAELLHEHSLTIENEKFQRLSSSVMKSSKYIYELLINLLEWTRIQTGKITITPEWFDLNEVINDQINISLLMAEAKNLKLYPLNQTNSAHMVYADKNMIHTVVRNFLSNAIKYTPEGGIISIGLVPENGRFKVSIADTGTGISKSQIENLLQMKLATVEIVLHPVNHDDPESLFYSSDRVLKLLKTGNLINYNNLYQNG